MSNENYKVLYEHAINSNIKLVDENKFFKLDNEILLNIINEVKEYIDKYSRYCSNKEYFSTRNPISDLKIILNKVEGGKNGK